MVLMSLRALMVIALVLALPGCRSMSPPRVQTFSAQWVKTSAPEYPGKQDDLFFVDPDHGVYVNGAGDIFRTSDGATTWVKVLSWPGTYWRAVGLIDERHGFWGNIGTDYFPNVTDETPLYRTSIGSDAPQPVVTQGPQVKGICAIDVLKTKFINAGVLEDRVIIHAAGRVGGPAWLLRSLDGGEHFKTIDLSAQLAMVTDVKFFSERVGFVVGATDSDLEQSHALILKTTDGGLQWQRVYESTRTLEMIWKVAFATPQVGYATIMHYDPNRAAQLVAKTTDGGRTWLELPLTSNAKAREFGVAFATPDIGWVGTAQTGFQTLDGGRTWAPVNFGRSVNKIRVVPSGGGFVAYAIGSTVYKLDARPSP